MKSDSGDTVLGLSNNRCILVRYVSYFKNRAELSFSKVHLDAFIDENKTTKRTNLLTMSILYYNFVENSTSCSHQESFKFYEN